MANVNIVSWNEVSNLNTSDNYKSEGPHLSITQNKQLNEILCLSNQHKVNTGQ